MEFNNKKLNPKFKKNTSKDSIVSFKIREARGTRWLSFNKMKLVMFPQEMFSKLKNLKHLYMSSCSLSGTLPLEFGQLQQLEVIDLSVNKITTIPDSLLTHFLHLKTLDLRCNLLTSLPYTVEYMQHLEELSLAQNKLVALPHSISRLPALRILDCSENLIRDLQGDLFTGVMKDSLKVLNFDNNKLDKFPRSLGCLENLEELGIAYNELYFLPPTAKSLRKLQVLRYAGNRWDTPLTPRNLNETFDVEEPTFGPGTRMQITNLVFGPE